MTPPAHGITASIRNRITGAAGYSYTYDADGNRVQKSNGTTGTLYWYMTPGIVAESDLAGTLNSEYLFFGGERVARRDLPGGAVSYYFSDHLKTASVITDSAGNIKEDEDFYPWGGELQFVNNDSNHYKFTGKERDAETNLDYFGARYYSNGLGRFITPDWSTTPEPVPYADWEDPQSLNQYSYVRNVPTVKVDLDGHGCPPVCDLPTPTAEDWKLIKAAGKGATGISGSAILTGVAIVLVPATVFAPSVGQSNADERAAMEQASRERAAQNGGVDPELGHARGVDEEKSQSDIASDRARTNGGIAYSVGFDNSLKQSLKSGQKNSVDIEYTGSRSDDADAANAKAGFKETPKGYTWHHVANYNAKTNTGTMQLVKRTAHKKFHHGGVKQWEDANKKKYKP